MMPHHIRILLLFENGFFLERDFGKKVLRFFLRLDFQKAFNRFYYTTLHNNDGHFCKDTTFTLPNIKKGLHIKVKTA